MRRRVVRVEFKRALIFRFRLRPLPQTVIDESHRSVRLRQPFVNLKSARAA